MSEHDGGSTRHEGGIARQEPVRGADDRATSGPMPGSASGGTPPPNAERPAGTASPQGASSTPRLTLAQRRAQAAALCGLLRARNRRFNDAETRFAEAITLDPDLDLTALPRFWDLPRGGHDAAVGAYERVGRVRDAATLAAWLRWTFRPQAVPIASARADEGEADRGG